jgi:pimeloyl-ACP methyl ester carboxylesterase
MGAADGSQPGAGWLTDVVKEQYRSVWRLGLTGALNYYRASPLKPPTSEDRSVMEVTLPAAMTTVRVPTLVLWGTADTALPERLLQGLEAYVADLRVLRLEGATHWVIHEQPARIAREIDAFVLP